MQHSTQESPFFLFYGRDARISTSTVLTHLRSPYTVDVQDYKEVLYIKPAKAFLQRKFDEWYMQQVKMQLDGKSDDEIEEFELQPIDLSMARMKEVSAEWLVEMATYIAENPQFLVNGFLKSGIVHAIDDTVTENETDEEDTNSGEEESEWDDDDDVEDD